MNPSPGNRYDYFAGAAKKDGFVQIADISFTETALQERTRQAPVRSLKAATWNTAASRWHHHGTEATLYAAAAAGEHRSRIYWKCIPLANIADS